MAMPSTRQTGLVQALSLASIVSLGPRPRSPIRYRVQDARNPDDTEFQFVSGVGFVNYEYHYHEPSLLRT